LLQIHSLKFQPMPMGSKILAYIFDGILLGSIIMLVYIEI